MASDVFNDELRRLISGADNRGVMYAGWDNPMNKASDKGPNGAYATPFDRNGGGAINDEISTLLTSGILEKVSQMPVEQQAAMRQLLDVLKGTGQSPTDKGGGAPVVGAQGSSAMYGGTMSADEQVRYAAWRAAEDAKAKEDADKKSEKDAEDKMMSMFGSDSFQKRLAETFAPVIGATIKSEVTAQIQAAMSAFSQPQTQSQPAQQSAPAQQTVAGAWRDLPGVALPSSTAQGASSPAQMSAQMQSDSEAKAGRFLQLAVERAAQISDHFQRGRLMESANQLFAGISSGYPVSIDDPMLQGIATAAGVTFTNLGFGGGM